METEILDRLDPRRDEAKMKKRQRQKRTTLFPMDPDEALKWDLSALDVLYLMLRQKQRPQMVRTATQLSPS